MSDTISPPPGFSLVQPDTAPKPPPGFSLVEPEKTAEPGTTRDIARGMNRGLLEGVGSILGLPGDVVHMIDKGSMWALTKGAEKAGLISPETAEAVRNHVGYTDPHYTDQLQSDAINKHLLKLASSAGLDTDAPTTVAGKYAHTIGSFAPVAATMGGTSLPGIARSVVKNAIIPGAVSEAGGQLTEGTSLEPYARVAGAVAPAALEGAVSGFNRASNPLRGSMEGVAPAQEAEAQALLDQSRAAGAPITVPEAIQSATGSATRLGDLQRVVEQSPKGGEVLKPFFAQRPEQTQSLGMQTLDRIAAGPTNPFEVAPRVQEASANTVSAADKARSAAVKPLYTSAGIDTVPVDEMEGFLGKLDKMIADDKSGLISPQLTRMRDSLIETPAKPGVSSQRVANTTPTGASIYTTIPAVPAQPRVPITDIENLDNARKYFRDQIAQPAVAQDAIPKQVGAKMGSLLDDLNTMMETHSGDFAAAKQRYQQITNSTVEPLLRSPTGQLAVAETFPKQAAILFNPNPLPGSEVAIGNAVRQVARADPDAASQMVRLHLEKAFNEATQNNLPGANQFGAPKFAAVIAGNSQQAKNLEAAVRALPDGDTRWGALRRGLDIMEAMGKRQAVGSQTEFNRQINEFLRSGNPVAEIAATATSPGKWASLARNVYENFTYGRNTANFARIFTEGNVADLRKMSGAATKSVRGQAALIGALALQGARAQPTATQQQP